MFNEPTVQYFQAVIQVDLAVLVALAFQVKLFDFVHRDRGTPDRGGNAMAILFAFASLVASLQALAAGPNVVAFAVSALAYVPVLILAAHLLRAHVLEGLMGWRLRLLQPLFIILLVSGLPIILFA